MRAGLLTDTRSISLKLRVDNVSVAAVEDTAGAADIVVAAQVVA